ncbi:hypothetical protein OSB04_010412 [Centaurea solstitialis]|uniref:NIN-like protein n=1 Tax=Centaurea solstitialis TaxID=347529 RepID=A0AA38TF40_9ASTR|nr:hypothetical protein OSB04_010412 [Centaurea solstitialis]
MADYPTPNEHYLSFLIDIFPSPSPPPSPHKDLVLNNISPVSLSEVHIDPIISSSASHYYTDHDPPIPESIEEKVLYAFKNLPACSGIGLSLQFWVPIKIGGRWLLTTSDQPFAIASFDKDLQRYRLCCVKHKYNLDLCKVEVEDEEDPTIISTGAPATVFLSQLPLFLGELMDHQMTPLASSARECGLMYSFVLPVFNRSCVVGVIECSTNSSSKLFSVCSKLNTALELCIFHHFSFSIFHFSNIPPAAVVTAAVASAVVVAGAVAAVAKVVATAVVPVVTAVAAVEVVLAALVPGVPAAVAVADDEKGMKEGLNMFHARDYLPYKFLLIIRKGMCNHLIPMKQTICGLQNVKNEIDVALKVIEQTHCLRFAQVWIPYEDDTRTKQRLWLKLTGHNRENTFDDEDSECLEDYGNACYRLLLKMDEGLAVKTLERYEPHFIQNILKLTDKPQRLLSICIDYSCFVIYLRSTKTGGLVYVVEFLWSHEHGNGVIESLLLRLMECLPSFKFASGAKVGDELLILDVENSREGEFKYFKIFQRNQWKPVAPKGGRRFEVEECSRPSKAKCKTTPIPLSREDIQPHFGKTMIEAAKNLNVSLSTLKRKCKALGIYEWHGKDYLKKNVIHSYKNQSDTNKEEHKGGEIQDPLANNRETYLDENTVTIKAEYADDMIKFYLPISSTTFGTIKKEISEGFKLNPSDYKIKYLDEDGDWILLSSEKGMRACVRIPEPIQEKIVCAFNSVDHYLFGGLIQFWAPVKTGGRIVLSAFNQPFALSMLKIDSYTSLDKYRLCSLNYQYDIDCTNLGGEYQPMIISGAAASAFLNRVPELLPDPRVYQRNPLVSCALNCGLKYSVLLPLYDPPQNCCVGVVECSMESSDQFLNMFHNLNTKLQKVGLKTYDARQLLQNKTICGLQQAKDEIDEALKIIFHKHGLENAQVWIASKEANHVTLLSTLEAVETTRMLGIKLTSYSIDWNDDEDDYNWCFSRFQKYNDACNILPLKMEEGLAGKTLQNYEPHFIKKVSKLSDEDKPQRLLYINTESSCFVIYLRSIKTDDLVYVFEFLWSTNRNIDILFEALLLTLKRCLPSFKFASGAELGDELFILDVDNSRRSENKYFKIFQRNKLSIVSEAPKERQPEGGECLTPLKSKCKTTSILLFQEDIEPQFGKTMTEAAKSLNVSVSTLKRKCKVLGIPEWQGKDYLKRNVNHASKNQSNTNEEENNEGASQDPLANIQVTSLGDNIVTIKAHYADDTIKFHLPISSTTFMAIEKEVSEGFKLNPSDYKVKYLDEDGDWILLSSDKDMRSLHDEAVWWQPRKPQEGNSPMQGLQKQLISFFLSNKVS